MSYKIKLSNIPFFRYIPPRASKELASSYKVVSKKKGDNIVLYGDDVSGLFVIIAGKVDVYTEKFKTRLAALGPGSSFGEMSLIDNLMSSANIRAAEDNTKLLLQI